MDGSQALYLFKDGVTRELANTTGPFSQFGNFLSVNDRDEVAFLAFLDTFGASINLATMDGIVELDGNASISARPSLNNSGETVFSDRLGEAILRNVSGVTSTVLDNTSGEFSRFGPFLDTNDLGDVLFLANLPGGGPPDLFFLSGDGLASITREAGIAPLAGIDLNNRGDIIFGGFVLDSEGVVIDSIFSFQDGAATPLITSGDTLDGLVVSFLAFNQGALNERGQFAFVAGFEDGSFGTYRANLGDLSEIPAPAAFWLIGSGLGLLRLRRRARST